MPIKQIPESTHEFDNSWSVRGAPNYWVGTKNACWHNEPMLICLIPIYYWHRGDQSNWLPLWRMNGAGPNDSKIPVILAHGMFSNRAAMDYYWDGEIYSLARFLANRGRDVWIIEFEQAEKWGMWTYQLDTRDKYPDWADWYITYLLTTNEEEYDLLDTFFQSQDVCTTQTTIVTQDDNYTSTVDDLVFEDLPAIITAVLNITGQTQVQWVGHSLGGLVMYGLLPTHYMTDGKIDAGYIDPTGWANLPPDSVLSLTAIASPTALIDVPDWLMDLKTSGDIDLAYTKRGKLPVRFNYRAQQDPKGHIALLGVIDTAQLKHLGQAIDLTYFSFFNTSEFAQQYYHTLYEGGNLAYAWPEWTQFTVYGHTPTVPVTAIYDGNGFDQLGTFNNVTWLFNKLGGYKCLKPFYQFSPAHTVHSEILNGYLVDGGIPGWPPHLQYDFGGTYHYVWYDLQRYLPPDSFMAYQNNPITSTDPLISWQNNKDAVSYELWGKQEPGSFSKKGLAANQVASAMHCQNLTSGVWKIKVRAYSLGGSWRDHSGASSIGELDNESKYLTITKS